MSKNQHPTDPKHLEILNQIPAAPICGHWPHAGMEAALAAERARADAAEADLREYQQVARQADAYARRTIEQLDAAVAALRTVRESILAPWTAGGFVCCGCGEWSEQRETIPHEACWLSDEARAILQAADQRGGEVGE